MALVSTDDRHYKNIAQAIRNKLGTEELLLPEQMAGAINSIGGFMKNYQGTTIHADDTYYCNMVANRNKVEVLGQTIQNCLDHSSVDKFTELQGTIEDGYILLSGNSKDNTARLKIESGVLKPNTTYTFIVDIKENTLAGSTEQLKFEEALTSKTYFIGSGYVQQIAGKLGIYKFTLKTKSEFTSDLLYSSAVLLNSSFTSGTIKFRYAIVEGDWTNKEISFVPFGLNYPETTEVIETGKNILSLDNIDDKDLINCTKKDSNTIISNIKNDYYCYISITRDNYKNIIDYVENNKGKNIIFSTTQIETKLMSIVIIGNFSDGKNYKEESSLSEYVKMTIPNNLVAVDRIELRFNRSASSTFSDTTTEFNDFYLSINEDNFIFYEPCSERKVNINYPLASVTDTVRDRYYVKNGKKYHDQVIKEIVFDGSDDEIWADFNEGFYLQSGIPNANVNKVDVMCDKFIYSDDTTISMSYRITNTGSSYSPLFRNIPNVTTVQQFKDWLKSNNVKMLYSIFPIITIEIETEDMQSFDGQTNITTTNTVKTPMDLDIPTALVINSGKEM